MVVTSWNTSDAGNDTGSAFVFERNHGGLDNWGEVKKALASDTAANAAFGRAAAIDEKHFAIGTPRVDTGATDAGAVYIFDIPARRSPLGTVHISGEIPVATTFATLAYPITAAGSHHLLLVGAYQSQPAASAAGFSTLPPWAWPAVVALLALWLLFALRLSPRRRFVFGFALALGLHLSACTLARSGFDGIVTGAIQLKSAQDIVLEKAGTGEIVITGSPLASSEVAFLPTQFP